jgi:subtilisin family serine protease
VRLLRCLLVLVSVLLPVPLAAQPQNRLEPAIRQLLRPEVRSSIRARRLTDLVQGVDAPPRGALAVEADAAGVPRLGVFVQVSSTAGINALRAAGGEVGSVAGDVVSAWLPIDALEAVGQAPGIVRVQAARVLTIVHDSSMRAVHVDELRALAGGTWTGATGQGALVAIYDTGIDLLHDDFRSEAGESRVLGAWDQTNSGRPPAGFAYGYHCDATAIRDFLAGAGGACAMRDFNGHGSHVAGTAAGDGSAGSAQTAFAYAGVAPGADLIIVKGGNGFFAENRIIDGLNWIKQEAQRLGRPVVVNLSLGSQSGPHDGTSAFDRAVDNLSGPGFIVVASAGNMGINRNTTPVLGGALFHARATVTGTQPITFEMNLPQHTPSADACDGNATAISIWYPGADRLRIEVIRPSGSSATAEPGQSQVSTSVVGRIAIDNASQGADTQNGDYEASILIDGCGQGSGAPESGTWTLRLTPTTPGSGRPVDAWVGPSQHGTTGVEMMGTTGFDNRFVIGSPGTATRAVTVGAFATRMCWSSQTASGQTCYLQREEVGDLARFSSGGPRRDGVMKPDITAPGLGIVSVRSRDAILPVNVVLPDNAHSVLQGTSMAAPHVTGAIAVLYQARPSLTPEEVKSILAGSASRDGYTTRTYDPAVDAMASDWWGFGKLNVRDAFLGLTGVTPAVLAVGGADVAPRSPTTSSRGARMPLLRLQFASQGPEDINVIELTVRVRGTDPGARLVLIRDANGNGSIDAGEGIAVSVPIQLQGTEITTKVAIPADNLRVSAANATHIILAIEFSGSAPNGSSFEATFVPGATRSIGVSSHVQNTLNVSASTIASSAAATSVLRSGERVTLSANPVRGDRVIFNFIEAPTTAAVYTVTGRHVIDLRTEGLSREWDLRNAGGSPVAPGVYLLVFTVQGQVFREKLIVLGPGSDD